MLSAVETFGPAAASATNAYAAAAAAAAAAQQHHHHNSHLQHLPQQHHHHQLAHHNPFALAAAAAASVVMPPTQGQTETNQLSLDHYTIAGHGPLLGHHPHLNSHSHHLNHLNHLTHPSGIYLSSLPSVIPSTTAAVTSSMSLLRQQHQQQHRDSIVSSTLLPSPPSSSSSISYSLSTTASNNSAISPCSSPAKSPSSSSTIRSIKDSSNTSNLINNNNNNSHNNNLMIDNNKTTVSTMSITEFVRPHPKQPRYNSNSNGSNNNNNNNNNNNSNSLNNNNNNNSINNNTIGSNGIPLLGRNKLSPPSSEYLNGNSPKNSLSKYSNEPPQTGPVNLVTNNNNNNNRDYSKGFNKETNNNNRITPPNSLTDLDLKKASGTDISCSTENLTKDNLCTSLYSQKLQFTPPTAALAAPYQFNYPSLYARGAIYGTPALYSGHHPALNGRSNQIVHSRPPAFLNSAHPELQPFSQYLSPTVVYSPPGTNTSTTAVGSGGIPVPSLQQQASPTNLLRSSTVVNENLPNSKSPLQSQLPLQSPLSPSQQKTSPNLSQQQSQQSSTSQSFVPQSSSLPQSNFITATEQQRALLGQQQQQQQQHHHSYYQQQQHHHHHQHQSDKNMGGIKLTVNNDKKLHQNNSNDGGSFKVPSGKEGSLKHRFLTRPKSDRDLKRRSPNSINRHQNNSNGSSAPSNFTKGSYIELANGLLRRVEDMRTEDFIQSAEKSERHQLVDSTVVKISNTPNSVIITFSYDKNRSKADIEVSQEHPFFVYGQGWASCNPDISLQHFGLKCKRLQVGDVCISLIEVTSPTATSSTSSLSTLSSIGKNPSSSSCSSSCSSDSCITNSPSASPIIDVTTVAPNQPQNLTTTGSGSIRLNTNTTTIDDIKNQVNHYHHNTLPQLSSYDMHHNNMQQTHHNSRNVGSYDGSISRHHASNNNNNNNNNNNTNSIAANTPLILQNGVNNNRDIVNHHSHHSHHNHHLTQQHNLQQHSQQQQQQQQRIGSGKHSSLSDSHYLIPPQSHGHPLALHQHQQQSLTAPSSTKNIEFKFSSPSIHQQQQQQQQQQPFYLGKSATLLAPTTCRSASPPRINHHQSQNYHKSSDESHDSIFDSSDINTNISRKRRWSAPEDKCDDDNHNDNENNNNNNNNNNNDNDNCNSNGERHEKISANGKNNNRNSDGDN